MGLALLLAIVSVLGFIVLGRTVIRLVRLMRDARESSVVLSAGMALPVPTAGPKTLYLEAPRFTSLMGLRFELFGPDGAPCALRRVLFRMQSSSLRLVRTSWLRFDAPAPGTYQLRAQGLPRGDAEVSVLVYRRHERQVVGLILAIVVSAQFALGGFTGAILLAAQALGAG